MIKFVKINAVLFSTLLFASCSGVVGAEGEDGNDPANLFFTAASKYDCGTGGGLIIKWSRDVAWISFEGKTWLLPRASSGSGARYSDGLHEAWEHQGALRWTDAWAKPITCRKITGE